MDSRLCLPAAIALSGLASRERASRFPSRLPIAGRAHTCPNTPSRPSVLAHGLGAAYIEQDVTMSADGVLVVLHDVTLDATTDVAARFPGRARADGKHYAIDFSLAELKSLAVRERVRPETGERVYPGRYSGDLPVFRIATLEESLALIRSLNASTGREAGVYPEIKRPAWHLAQGRDLGAAVVEMLRRFGYEEKADACFLQCFEFDEIRRLREDLGYHGRLIQLLGGGDKIAEGNTDFAYLRSPAGLRELAKWVEGIGPPIGEIVKGDSPAARIVTSLVADARAAGLAVHPYTARADDLPKWAESYDDLVATIREAGVEGYFTDFPGLAK